MKNFIKRVTSAHAKPKGSIEHKLARSLLLMAIGVAGVLIAINIVNMFVSNTRLLKSGTSSTIQSAASYAERVLNLSAINARALTSSDTLQNLSLPQEARIAALRDIVNKNGYIEAGFLDKTGNGFSDKGEVNYADNPIFANAKSCEAYISEPTAFGLEGKPCVISGAPIYDNYGAGIIGTVYIAQDAALINEKLSTLTFGETGYAYVLGLDGSIVYQPSTDNIPLPQNIPELAEEDSGYKSQAKAIITMLDKREGTIRYKDAKGTSIYSVYKPIDNYSQWVLVLCAPSADFFGIIQSSIFISVLIAAVFCFIAVILLRSSMRKMVSPATAVQTRLDALARGDVKSEVVLPDTGDELGEISYSLTHTIEQLRIYLSTLSEVLGGVADGDMTVTAHSSFDGDFKSLEASIAKIVYSVNSTLLTISNAISEVALGSQMVADGANTLSNGAIEQADAVDRLSQTVLDIKASIENAEQYTSLAGSEATATGRELERSNSLMNDMIAAMDEIGSKAEQIGDIIKTIESIAFETNLLALNAAVEAAHAGKQGQSFAVVAGEVRVLASKSAEAARSTTALIRQSVASIENGVALARETSVGMKNVMSDAGHIVGSIQDLSKAAKEQTKTVGSIASEMDKISAVVKTNTTTATASAKASSHLLLEAQSLKSIIAGFTLSDTLTPYLEQDYTIQTLPEDNPDDIRVPDGLSSYDNIDLSSESEAVTI